LVSLEHKPLTMDKEKFIALLSSKLSGEISGADNEALTKATESNEEYQLLATQLSQYFQQHKTHAPKMDQLSQAWKLIERAENQGFEEHFNYSAVKRTSLYATLLKVAAVLVLLVGTGVFSYHLLNRNTDPDFSTMTATKETTFRLLDDGTKVWLNKKSTLTYNKAFGKQQREIFLEGEAYFDVAKNKEIPLFIHAGNIDIEVKGTAFNVNAYKNNPDIQVALVRGLIQVSNRLDHKHSILLRPNEKLIFAKLSPKDEHFTVQPMASNLLLKETRWISDTLTFQKEKLKDLALRMEKKYDLKIEVKSEQLKEKRFSGTFTNETIQQALEALKLSYPLTYTISNKLVVIKD
jgi:transmembrane sensor